VLNIQILQEIGFSKGEIKVYFALLELGETTIGPLSKKASVTPAKVYPILDKLSSKGLSSYIIKSGTKYFRAASPNQIISFLDEKSTKIDEEKEEIKKIIPQIEAKQEFAKEIHSAEIYQTFDGMRTLYNEALRVLKENKEEFIGFTLGEEEYKFKESEYFFQEYDTKRRSLRIKVKLLGHISQKKFMQSITRGDRNITVKYLPYRLPTGVIIFGDKVATIVWEDIPTAFVIQSKQVANSYKRFFEAMWKISKK
jgi:sugar-specific transcriptional regulator TrmB